MNTFSKWYSSVNESIEQIAADRKEEVIREVDAILASLEELSTQLKEEHDLVDPAPLNESLILENTDEIKAVLDADPLLALLKVGVFTTVAAVGGAAYTLKTAKKHKKIRANMEADYAKLKQYKMELAKSEVTKAQLELKRQELNEDEINLEDFLVDGIIEKSKVAVLNKSQVDKLIDQQKRRKAEQEQNLANVRANKAKAPTPEAKAKADKVIKKIQDALAKITHNIKSLQGDKKKEQEAAKQDDNAPKAAAQDNTKQDTAPAKDNTKQDTTTPPAEEKPDKNKEKKVDMKKKLDNQIEDMKVRIEQLEAPVKEFEASLEQKYSEDKLSTTMGGQGGKSKELKAHLIDDITVSVAEYKLKALGSDMEKSVKKETEERIQDAQKRQKKRIKKIKDEQEKSLEKIKEENPEKREEIEDAVTQSKEDGMDTPTDQTPKSGQADTDNLMTTTTTSDTETDSGDGETTEKPEGGETTEQPKEEPTEEPKEEPVDKTDNSKEGMTKRVDALIKKYQESGEEEKLKKAKELKANILKKESWQIEGTKLGILLESELRKLEMSEMIKESLSIRDRFSKLI